MDAGAWTPLCIHLRSVKNSTLFEELTGPVYNYTRIGGVSRDVPEGWLEKVINFVDQLPKAMGK